MLGNSARVSTTVWTSTVLRISFKFKDLCWPFAVASLGGVSYIKMEKTVKIRQPYELF